MERKIGNFRRGPRPMSITVDPKHGLAWNVMKNADKAITFGYNTMKARRGKYYNSHMKLVADRQAAGHRQKNWMDARNKIFDYNINKMAWKKNRRTKKKVRWVNRKKVQKTGRYKKRRYSNKSMKEKVAQQIAQAISQTKHVSVIETDQIIPVTNKQKWSFGGTSYATQQYTYCARLIDRVMLNVATLGATYPTTGAYIQDWKTTWKLANMCNHYCVVTAYYYSPRENMPVTEYPYATMLSGEAEQPIIGTGTALNLERLGTTPFWNKRFTRNFKIWKTKKIIMRPGHEAKFVIRDRKDRTLWYNTDSVYAAGGPMRICKGILFVVRGGMVGSTQDATAIGIGAGKVNCIITHEISFKDKVIYPTRQYIDDANLAECDQFINDVVDVGATGTCI